VVWQGRCVFVYENGNPRWTNISTRFDTGANNQFKSRGEVRSMKFQEKCKLTTCTIDGLRNQELTRHAIV
jgi:hypothetical protein